VREGRVARRYAQAFFELVSEKGLLDEAQQDLDRVMRLVQEIEELEPFLAHQGIPPAEKKAMLRRIFADQVAPLTLNFLLLLCDRRREAHLKSIHEHFQALALEAKGVAEAEVRSAVPLKEEQVRALEARLSQATGHKIRLKTRLEPKLMGGLVVKLGDRVFDGSLVQRLESLKEHIRALSLEELRGDKAG
jgi:F-type H+-transporting ATPase subunit delta